MSTWRREWNVAGLLAVALCAAWPATASAGLTEQWYLMRARSNVEIKNYRAAIEAYAKVLEDNPHHREALRGLGTSCEANGETDRAIATFDRYLARYSDDAEIAFRQARFLGWSRYQYRRSDAIKYYRMGLALEDRPAERLAMAKLLAQDKATIDEAVVEYRRLVERSPQDGALRAEYRKVLLWDPRHRAEAIRELERHVEANPRDAAASRQLAALLVQQPGRLDDGLKRYEGLLERAPQNRLLRLEYARALAKDPARTAQAAAQLEQAMGPKPSRETRLLYAELLAAQPERRDDALAQYRALVEETPDDAATRLKYAQLLGGEEATAAQAITHYERVLTRDRDNAEAHAGLARAYAWKGENDRALRHQREAVQHGAGADDLPRLGAALEQGREPRLGGGVRMFVQPGGPFHLLGFQLPVTGRRELSEFVTASAEAGFETFFGPDARFAAGAFVAADTELRFTRTERVRVGLGLRSVRPGAESVSAFGEFEHRGETWSVRPRLERLPVMDSFHSLVGEGGLGAVSANVLRVGVEHRQRNYRIWVTPRLALLTGGGVEATYQLGFDGGAELALLATGPWSASVGYEAATAHFGADHSLPAMGGYYSPAVHLVQTPRLTVRHVVDGAHWAELSGGPSLQYQHLHTGNGQWMPGVQARLSSTFRLTRALELTGSTGVATMGDAYLRIDAAAMMQFLF